MDKEGWQYATDFPASYSGKCGFTDCVRRFESAFDHSKPTVSFNTETYCRRRWARKCRLQTTGPWKQLCPTKLVDISMQVSHNGENNPSKKHMYMLAMNILTNCADSRQHGAGRRVGGDRERGRAVPRGRARQLPRGQRLDTSQGGCPVPGSIDTRTKC